MMSAKQTKTEENPVPMLSVMPGGLDGDGPWLFKLDVGTSFLVKQKSQGMQRIYGLVQVELAAKTRKSALLFNQITKEPGWVDVNTFCLSHDLWEILDKPEPEKKEEKKDEVNVTDYRAV